MQYKKDPSAPSSTKGEVLANSITHGIGVGLSIAGIVVLILGVSVLQRGNYMYSEYEKSILED